MTQNMGTQTFLGSKMENLVRTNGNVDQLPFTVKSVSFSQECFAVKDKSGGSICQVENASVVWKHTPY